MMPDRRRPQLRRLADERSHPQTPARFVALLMCRTRYARTCRENRFTFLPVILRHAENTKKRSTTSTVPPPATKYSRVAAIRDYALR